MVRFRHRPIMKFSRSSALGQNRLIEELADHNRDDDIDCVLRDALRHDSLVAPPPGRGFGALRNRLLVERQPVRLSRLLAAPDWPRPYMPFSYWYLEPLVRIMR